MALISGGGAGHEPAHAGYVAAGMLTAAVSGEVFASPSVDAVLEAIRAVTGDAGCLLIVKSYTGDRLNFGLAAEIARSEGLRVETVVVADDVAITASDANAGRRGLAGTVLVHKAAGACAEAGGTLAEVAATARQVADAVGTIGVGLSGVTVPGSDGPGFTLAEDEVEVGLGIHGEPGVAREPMRLVDDLVADLVRRVAADRGLVSGDRVVALVGSAGATPAIELNIVARALAHCAEALGLTLVRLWQGPVMTSLDMAGISVTLLPLPPDASGDHLLALLDAPTGSRAWPGGPPEPPRLSVVAVPKQPSGPAPATAEHDAPVGAALAAACHALLNAETELTRLDQVVGDGDLGSALARGARAWLADPARGTAGTQVRELSVRARRVIGGTSGPLYAVGLLAAAEALDGGADWPSAFGAAVEAVAALGGAQLGDRTMLDALVPAGGGCGRAGCGGGADGRDAGGGSYGRPHRPTRALQLSRRPRTRPSRPRRGGGDDLAERGRRRGRHRRRFRLTAAQPPVRRQLSSMAVISPRRNSKKRAVSPSLCPAAVPGRSAPRPPG